MALRLRLTPVMMHFMDAFKKAGAGHQHTTWSSLLCCVSYNSNKMSHLNLLEKRLTESGPDGQKMQTGPTRGTL